MIKKWTAVPMSLDAKLRFKSSYRVNDVNLAARCRSSFAKREMYGAWWQFMHKLKAGGAYVSSGVDVPVPGPMTCRALLFTVDLTEILLSAS